MHIHISLSTRAVLTWIVAGALVAGVFFSVSLFTALAGTDQGSRGISIGMYVMGICFLFFMMVQVTTEYEIRIDKPANTIAVVRKIFWRLILKQRIMAFQDIKDIKVVERWIPHLNIWAAEFVSIILPNRKTVDLEKWEPKYRSDMDRLVTFLKVQCGMKSSSEEARARPS